MHFYTSVNINYLPKARVLAETIKQHCPNAWFSLVFSDQIPAEIKVEDECFDEIVTVEELGIPVENLDTWIFSHTVVELCTAVKGQALVKFLEGGSDKVVYLDPDIAVYDDLECLSDLLNQYSIVLTPHLTAPEVTAQGIVENELCALQHGSFNFGFYAVKNDKNGSAFAHWWRDRLLEYCYDNIPMGIFTDQKWGDLVPCMFEKVCIWRDPGCNVATWNITNRNLEKIEERYYVNDSLLKFYHFSGFDSGAQAKMLSRYGKGNDALYELRQWYIKKQDEAGQQIYASCPSKYNYYDNGEMISYQERQLLRSRTDVKEYFKDINPYITKQDKSYYTWYKNEIMGNQTNKHSMSILVKKIKRKLKQILWKGADE